MKYMQKKDPTDWNDSENKNMLSLFLGIHRSLWEDLLIQRVGNCGLYPILSRSRGAGRAAKIWVVFVAQWSGRTYMVEYVDGEQKFP